MENIEIVRKVKQALEMLLTKDDYLLTNDINERTISNKLACYLQRFFINYNVDCEYNKNVNEDDENKSIYILKHELKKLGLLKEKEIEIDNEVIERNVYPDIIIHKRNSEKNLCIIEMKKSTSKIPFTYDELKLKYYTSNQYDNKLNYKLGIFVELKINTVEPGYNLEFYSNGEKITIDEYSAS